MNIVKVEVIDDGDLIRAALNPALRTPHSHEGWIRIDTVSCPRCQATRALIRAAVALQRGAETEG